LAALALFAGGMGWPCRHAVLAARSLCRADFKFIGVRDLRALGLILLACSAFKSA
jgi:hypothetical protein